MASTPKRKSQFNLSLSLPSTTNPQISHKSIINSIIADAKNPALYTNRAMARLKLGHWESVIADCQTCLALSPSNMKAHYYLAQAQLSIRDFDSALENALAAHKLCAATNDKSLGAVTAMVLKCKKDRWGDREKKRLRLEREVEERMLDLLRRDRDEMLMAEESEIERRMIEEEANEKIATLSSVFEASRSQNQKKREVPDWAIDDISFDIMVDPVIVSFLTLDIHLYKRDSILIFPHRQKQANPTNAPPSWSISAATPPTPSPASLSPPLTCGPT
ncbi:hypothetical protein M431DRAFT_444049 [Trichoderma harzianum CBS 226.95]|uniref:RING-type E3 ubiquitin transferase n=1 Tax=Trichoderma harzianum CBS 226.95 TaxID=983964 RepID=A0A2T4A9V4_TRIHA|nr:hypothetical protein M431DRAFT_444049 [Trichoderma harzianum CBS 226.95]PTB53773.1 hypothetical protein M431DRAFT_444049 [Trichoderma harzianum CBS 226.95]